MPSPTSRSSNGDHVFLFGKKAGRTNLYVLGANGVLLRAIAVEVDNPTGRAQQLTPATPGAGDIHVGATANGLVVEGSAVNAAAAELAQRSAAENAPEKAVIDDRVKVRGSVQVTLRVRIAEVSRTITKQLGINWNAMMRAGNFAYGIYHRPHLAGRERRRSFRRRRCRAPGSRARSSAAFNTSGGSINGVIDALAEEGLVTILAEPTLTAISGETASFLAGGEFPDTGVAGAGRHHDRVQILRRQPEFRADGNVAQPYQPARQARGQPDPSQGAITISGLQIPALTVRRADTTIELGSGQSFAIAGLLQNNSNNDIQRFPGLGDLPVLGALFRSTQFQRNESELLIIVTPFIVKPIDDPKAIRLPTDAWRAATDLERIFKGYVASPASRRQARGIAPSGPRSAGGASASPRHRRIRDRMMGTQIRLGHGAADAADARARRSPPASRAASDMGNLTSAMPKSAPVVTVREQQRHLSVICTDGAIGDADWARIDTFLADAAAGRPGTVRLIVAASGAGGRPRRPPRPRFRIWRRQHSCDAAGREAVAT